MVLSLLHWYHNLWLCSYIDDVHICSYIVDVLLEDITCFQYFESKLLQIISDISSTDNHAREFRGTLGPNVNDVKDYSNMKNIYMLQI